MQRIFINKSLCAGCKNCEAACMAEHTTHRSLWLVNLSDPSNKPNNRVALDNSGQPTPIFCQHCDDPACVTACMAGALTKNPETGVVEHNRDKCAGCWMCIMSCPYGMMHTSGVYEDTAAKCDFCAERGTPRCVSSCPTGAITLRTI
ncbi:4Fe-4S dicluster domain-containing protein [Bacillota bacterium LX-D]|nr:4Fe-4S dicluster domain-containing protein [Bacillota bacterium LX-D]